MFDKAGPLRKEDIMISRSNKQGVLFSGRCRCLIYCRHEKVIRLIGLHQITTIDSNRAIRIIVIKLYETPEIIGGPLKMRIRANKDPIVPVRHLDDSISMRVIIRHGCCKSLINRWRFVTKIVPYVTFATRESYQKDPYEYFYAICFHLFEK